MAVHLSKGFYFVKSRQPLDSSFFPGEKEVGKGGPYNSENPESSGNALHRYPGIQDEVVLFIATASVTNANCPSPQDLCGEG